MKDAQQIAKKLSKAQRCRKRSETREREEPMKREFVINIDPENPLIDFEVGEYGQ